MEKKKKESSPDKCFSVGIHKSSGEVLQVDPTQQYIKFSLFCQAFRNIEFIIVTVRKMLFF